MQTPWGASQTVTELAAGVVQVTTSSHGGIRLDTDRNRQVHESWRDPAGWYEEDCEWSIVAVTFPAVFAGQSFPTDYRQPEGPRSDVNAYADQVARQYFPDQYTAVTGRPVTVAESSVLAQREFAAEHAADLVTIAAWGAYDEQTAPGGNKRVPAGMVGVSATVGGHRDNGPAERYYLVPVDEYRARDGRFGFVVDETRHKEIDPIDQPAAVAA